MYVFREGRRSTAGSELRAGLEQALLCLFQAPDDNLLMEALLRAGELECSLADAELPQATNVSHITTALAEAFIGSKQRFDYTSLLRLLPEHLPDRLEVSPPEGFAYYALHPRLYADLMQRLPVRQSHVLVVGIRTIGTTLSAVAAAGAMKRDLQVARITVRPTGHPYNRTTHFRPEHLSFIHDYARRGAEFVVVDEGPGMSGSSFLSVGDALLAAGVPRQNIHFFCSRQPDPAHLRAPGAADRWRNYDALYVGLNCYVPDEAKIYIGAGEWRKHSFTCQEQWPESWTQMERMKFFSPAFEKLFKFEGFGRFGSAVHNRAQASASAGFGPGCQTPNQGFGVYERVPGDMLCLRDLDSDVLIRIAEYCAFRTRESSCSADVQLDKLELMARFNFNQEFGRELQLTAPFVCEHPVIADARMQPHEWLRCTDGHILKLDGTTHGDDHFFPGPTDIAWDVAGAIVEWEMDAAAADFLIEQYRTRSGDDIRPRMRPFVLAYAIFRMGYCKMAAEAMKGTSEFDRLWIAYERYRAYICGNTGIETRKPLAGSPEALTITAD